LNLSREIISNRILTYDATLEHARDSRTHFGDQGFGFGRHRDNRQPILLNRRMP
jgi:hypothetical protein